jgi:hypothetical protein
MPNETRGQIHGANSSIEEIHCIVQLSLPNQEANLGIGTQLILVLVGFHTYRFGFTDTSGGRPEFPYCRDSANLNVAFCRA